MHIAKRTTVVVVAATAVVALTGPAAFAYWTFTGTSTGSGAATTGNAPTLTITGTATGLAPGLTRPLSYTITNPGPARAHITGVTVAVAAFSAQTVPGLPACTQADFTVAAQPVPLNADVAVGPTNYTSGRLTMTNSGTNQDNCQAANLASVPLSFTVS